MSDNILKVDTNNRIRVLTFNRPDQLNAMNDALYERVAEAFDAASQDPQVAVVVLTGEGRAFTAGQDLGELEEGPEYSDGQQHGFRRFRQALELFDKPLVAAVNGLGVGIGLTMLPYCDHVVMDEKARLKAPFVTLGRTVEAGNSYLLPSRIGWANAARILFTADWVYADDAKAVGLAQEIAPEGQVLETALTYAAAIAPMPVTSLVATKRLLLAARNDMVRAAHNREQLVFQELGHSPASREALAAFQEKRPADFSNC